MEGYRLNIQLNCMVKNFRISEKGVHAITVLERSGAEFVLRSKTVDLSKIPVLVPISITADCAGFVGSGMNYLDIRQLNVKALEALPE